MVEKSVKNASKIRAYIKTLAFRLGRGSKDIYVEICTVYGSNEMIFSTACSWVRKCNAGMESFKSAPKSGQPKSASSPRMVEKIIQIVKSGARYTSQQIVDMVGISKASVLHILQNNLKLKKKSARWVPHLPQRSKNAGVLRWCANV